MRRNNQNVLLLIIIHNYVSSGQVRVHYETLVKRMHVTVYKQLTWFGDQYLHSSKTHGELVIIITEVSRQFLYTVRYCINCLCNIIIFMRLTYFLD